MYNITRKYLLSSVKYCLLITAWLSHQHPLQWHP